MNNKMPALMSVVIIAISLIISSHLIALALTANRASERYVTVKGLAEREVLSDLAIWPITFSVTGNELDAVQADIDQATLTIMKYLAQFDFKHADIKLSPPIINDQFRHGVRLEDELKTRYSAEKTVTLRTDRIDALQQALINAGQMIKQGVVILDTYDAKPEYRYTQLNQIKPAMIQEATQNARLAAEQFANDSGSRVGAIKRAQQGLFNIEDRDKSSPEVKNIRVVTTMDYYLIE